MGNQARQNSRPISKHSGHEDTSVGEKLSLWIEEDEFRELTAVLLDDFGIVDAQRAFAELDDRLEEAELRREALKRSWRHARRRIALAIYPWLVLAPLGLMIAIQTRTSIKRSYTTGRSTG